MDDDGRRFPSSPNPARTSQMCFSSCETVNHSDHAICLRLFSEAPAAADSSTSLASPLSFLFFVLLFFPLLYRLTRVG